MGGGDKLRIMWRRRQYMEEEEKIMWLLLEETSYVSCGYYLRRQATYHVVTT